MLTDIVGLNIVSGVSKPDTVLPIYIDIGQYFETIKGIMVISRKMGVISFVKHGL